MIRRCAELHMRQIAHGGDPFETGSARPLDYGHWSAHKLEALTAHELRHGEAVAIGIALDSRYSVQIGMLAPGQEERIFAVLKRLGFYLWHPALERRDSEGRWVVLDGLREFREHLGGELTITLLREIGRGEEVHVMDEAEIRRAIAWLRHQEAAQ
jgi:3-dehydroquinate synthase